MLASRASSFQLNWFIEMLKFNSEFRYEDIVHKPEEQLISISKRFNISLIGQVENFLQTHNSARWKGNSKENTNSSKSSPESKVEEENPLKEIVKDMAIQKEFEKDTNIIEDLNIDTDQKEEEKMFDLEEGSSEVDEGTDYYDYFFETPRLIN